MQKVSLRVKSDLELIDVDDLEPLQGELKKLTDENFNKLRQSILEKGFKLVLHVWKNAGVNYLIDGHQRAHVLKQIKKQGIDVPKIPCAIIEAENYSQAKETVLLAVSQYGKIDKDGFEEFISGEDFNLDDFDFPDFDFEMDIESESKDGLIDDDATPETEQNEYNVSKGDVWILGEHRIMCGDSTNKAEVNKLMGGNKADMVLTDPPYNVGVNDESAESLKARNRRSDGLTIQNDKMSEDDFLEFLSKVFKTTELVMEEGASIYVFYADSMTIPFMSTFMGAGFHFAQNVIWNKQNFVMTRKDYHYKHEPCLYGWKKGAAHNWFTDRKQSSVWDFDRPFRNELHPTMKPIELLLYPIKNSSKEKDIVYEPFCGSGSTLIACEKTGRRCYGMELDEHYCSVTIKRWEDFTGEKAKKV